MKNKDRDAFNALQEALSNSEGDFHTIVDRLSLFSAVWTMVRGSIMSWCTEFYRSFFSKIGTELKDILAALQEIRGVTVPEVCLSSCSPIMNSQSAKCAGVQDEAGGGYNHVQSVEYLPPVIRANSRRLPVRFLTGSSS